MESDFCFLQGYGKTWWKPQAWTRADLLISNTSSVQHRVGPTPTPPGNRRMPPGLIFTGSLLFKCHRSSSPVKSALAWLPITQETNFLPCSELTFQASRNMSIFWIYPKHLEEHLSFSCLLFQNPPVRSKTEDFLHPGSKAQPAPGLQKIAPRILSS